jgi:hypothetical protein
VEPVRVLVIGLGGMIGAIIDSALAGDPEVEARRVPAADSLLPLVEEHRADVVILGSDESRLPANGRELLRRRPLTKVLTVGFDGRVACMYELRPARVVLGEVSPSTLLAAVKSRGTCVV